MDLIDRSRHLIEEHLISLDAKKEELSENIDRAGNAIVETLLQDGRIFTCANGVAANLARTLSLSLSDQFERERPGLPAINLDNDGGFISEMARENRFSECFAKPIRTLASDRDILVVFSIDGACQNIFQAIQAAHDKGMRVVAITGTDSNNITSIMLAEDCVLPLYCHYKSEYIQTGSVAVNILLDLIDCTLFGFPH